MNIKEIDQMTEFVSNYKPVYREVKAHKFFIQVVKECLMFPTKDGEVEDCAVDWWTFKNSTLKILKTLRKALVEGCSVTGSFDSFANYNYLLDKDSLFDYYLFRDWKITINQQDKKDINNV